MFLPLSAFDKLSQRQLTVAGNGLLYRSEEAIYERVGWGLAVVNVGVIACVAAARRFANKAEKAEQ